MSKIVHIAPLLLPFKAGQHGGADRGEMEVLYLVYEDGIVHRGFRSVYDGTASWTWEKVPQPNQ